VILILSVMFKSLKTGFMAATPTLFALVVIHGIMGGFRISLDIGTSLLGSLILANSVDYAVHLIASWRSSENQTLRHAAAYAADQSGPAIWTTAATMCVGFFILALGEAKPLQNVASLKATAMLLSALATFLVVPVLARRQHYQILNETSQTTEPSAAVDAVLLQNTTDNRQET
jgi:predicted RND superfamily exporter protein